MADHPLLADIEAFLAATGMAESTFGRLAMNDWKFVRGLRGEKPRRLWPDTEAKIRRFIAGYRAPAKAPQSTPTPTPAAQVAA